jgi:uncharacterized protein (TIGR03084 family)
MTPYEEVLSDLAEEHAALESVLTKLPDAAWEIPTHAPGWAVRDQVAHLASLDETALFALLHPDQFLEQTSAPREARAPRSEPEYLVRSRVMAPRELFHWWRTSSQGLVAAAKDADPATRVPWFGPPMSAVSHLTARLMECWSHGLDVVDVVNIERPPTDRLRHVVFLGMRTRGFSYSNRGLTPNTEPVRLELTAPSGSVWTYGEAGATNRISGSAVDFAEVTTRRRHLADTDLVCEGAAAEEWMSIAQTFAGPPGAGRQPGEFPKGNGS